MHQSIRSYQRFLASRDPYHIIVTVAELRAIRRAKLLRLASVWAVGLITLFLSGSSLLRQATSLNPYIGQNLAAAASTNVSVNFDSTVRTLAPYAFSGTISTYGQDGGSINSSAKQRSALNALGLGMYRVPLQWNGGAIVSSAGGHPGGSGDTWISNIRASGGEPMIVLGGSSDNNFSPSDGANMVQHFNSNPATKVTYWVIGNEPGNGGMSIQTYCTLFNSTVDAMKAVDSSIKVAGPAWAFFDANTLSTFLQCAGSRVDIIDYHHYAMGQSYLSEAAALSQTANWENEVTQTRQLINAAVPARAAQIGIQVGEYNWSWQTGDGYPGWNGDDRFFQAVNTVWGASVAGHIMLAGGRGHQYADQNGALSLTFEKNSDASHYGKTVDDPMPIYYGLEMFTGGNIFRRFGDTAVQASTSLPNTEVFASTNQKNIVLINKDPSATQAATINLAGVSNGTAAVWQTDKNAPFSPPTQKTTLTIANGITGLSLPPYSVTTLIVTETAAPPPAPSPAPTPAPAPSPPAPTPPTPPSSSSNSSSGNTSNPSSQVTISSNTSSSNPVVVSGTVQLRPDTSSTQVQYQIDGKPLSSNQLDTKTLSNGQHNITITQKTPDGKTKTTTQKVIVANRLSRSQRVALNLRYYGIPTILLIAGTAVLILATRRYIQWRYLRRHPLMAGTTLNRSISPHPPQA